MTKKTWIKIWIVLVITCVMWFSDWSLAADDAVNKSILESLGIGLNYISSFLSWWWVLLAKITGTFLTNKWVYGEILWLDALMWQYWNVMKNIANFWLWFYFVYVIFKWLISEWGVTKNLKNIIVWLLVAWIWIQSSWFFVATVIDVSTITLSAAGAFPSQVISSSLQGEEAIKKTLNQTFGSGMQEREGTRYSLFTTGTSSFLEKSHIKLKSQPKKEDVVDLLMPTADDVSGPLYYLWFSALEGDKVPSLSDNRRSMIFNVIIVWWTTIVFTIEMFVLCILAVMRVVYLWMFIIVSPIAVLLRCVEKSWRKPWNDNNSALSKFMKQINFKSFFMNAFKPTIIVLWFWVVMLFVSLMKTVVNDSTGRNIDIWWWTSMTSYQTEGNPVNWNEWDKKYTTTLDNDLVKVTLANTWKSFLELILSIITVILVYFIIKFAVTLWWWSDFVSKNIVNLQKGIEGMITSIPVIPVAWYDKDGKPTINRMNIWHVFGLWWEQQNLLERKISHYQGKVNEEYSRQTQIINSWFGDKKWYLTSDEEYTIKSVMATGVVWDRLRNVKAEIDKIRDENGKWMRLNSQTSSNNALWMNQFGKWLTDMKANKVKWMDDVIIWERMINDWNSITDIADIEKKLEKIFNGHSDRIRAYVKFFELSGDITNWAQLKEADISKK